MAVVLTPVLAKVGAHCPEVTHFTFADDRTLRAVSLQALNGALALWDQFSRITGMERNTRKDQLWPMTEAAEDHLSLVQAPHTPEGKVLGAFISRCGITSAKECKKVDEAIRMAKRTARLPRGAGPKVRETVSNVMVAAMASYGTVTSGVLPPAPLCQAYARAFRDARLGRSNAGGRDSRDLMCAISWGPNSDLCCAMTLRAIRTAARWARVALSQGRHPCPAQDSKPVKALQSCLHKFGWRIAGDKWVTPSGDDFCRLTDCDKLPSLLHQVRTSWRKVRFGRWLGAKRRDAQMAAQAGIGYRSKQFEEVHKLAKGRSTDEVAVMAGGFSTDATCGVLISQCDDCGQAVVPSVHHIFWQCPAYAHLRVHFRAGCPACPLAARLGWSLVEPYCSLLKREKVGLIRQLGLIRGLANDRRFQRWTSHCRRSVQRQT